ncbi:MAG TPA: hypothetical protein VEL79_04895 [Vicinamibacterales bacterium]|nr:hypothetical protein [Vicinamibacterales bacterium]
MKRTTASASWLRHRAPGSTSLTLAWGRNQKLAGSYDAYLGELTRAYRWTTIFWRVESTQVETNLLRTGVHTFQGGREDRRRRDSGKTGLRRRLHRRRSADRVAAALVEHGAGGELTGYAVPAALSPFYGTQPWSGQIFLRLRPPTMHHMTDVIMTRHTMPGMEP